MISHVTYPNDVYMFVKIHGMLGKIHMNIHGITCGNKFNFHLGGGGGVVPST